MDFVDEYDICRGNTFQMNNEAFEAKKNLVEEWLADLEEEKLYAHTVEYEKYFERCQDILNEYLYLLEEKHERN